MDRQLSEWKLGVERICSAAAPDYAEAARLAGDMARASGEAILRQAATQALPILRAASANSADESTRAAARRRLRVISDVLHALSTQQFGKRGTDPKPRPRSATVRCSACRSAAACPARKSIRPTSAPPSARIRTPAATRANFRNSPPRATR